MATNTLPGATRPAKIARVTTSLNRITARAVDMARLFTRHPANGCLLAVEG